MFNRKEYMKKYNKEYRELNRDKLISHSSEYYNKNKKKVLLHQKLQRVEKREYEKIRYKINNKKISNANYQKRKILAGWIDKEFIQKIYENNIKEHGTLTCSYCNRHIIFGEDSIDHKIPLSRGGKSVEDNLCISCISCNCSKGSKTPEEYKEFVCAL